MNQESLSEKAVRSTVVVAGATYLNQVLNFCANVALMRLIVPEHFGTVALGLFFLTLCRKVFGIGINSALVHKQDDLERAYAVHLTLNIAIAALTLIVVAIVAPLIEPAYGGGVVKALWAFAIVGVAEAAGHTPRLAMEKNLQFRRLMAINVSNTIVVNLIAIIVAALGFGLGALILRFVLDVLYDAVLLWIFSPIKPRLAWDRNMAGWFVRFGGQLWLGGLATFIIYQLDDWFVGTLISAVALGLYNRAYNLSLLPTSMVSQVAAKVAFPVYARLQSDRAGLSAAFNATVRGVSILTFPFSVLLFLVAPELVKILFGDAWLPMVPMLRALIIFSGARPMFDNTGDLFAAVGHPRTPSVIMVCQAVALALALWPATHFGGAVGAALAVGAVMIAGVVAAYVLLRRHVDVQYRHAFLGPLVASAMAFALTFVVYTSLGVTGPLALGALKAAAFCALFMAIMMFFEGGRIRQDFKVLAKLVRGESPNEPGD